jgi:SAM-dependent methyltransferase
MAMPGFRSCYAGAFYANEARDYAARPRRIGRHLDGFLEKLAPGARSSSLAAAAGRDAAAMEARGFKVDPTDGVPEMAKQAEARLGRPVRVMRFDELDASAAYDGVVAAYSLLHVPRAGLIAVLERVWRALRPGGWHIATYKTAGGEGRDRLGRYYNYPTEGAARLLRRSRDLERGRNRKRRRARLRRRRESRLRHRSPCASPD